MSSKEHQTTNGHWTMCFEKSCKVYFDLKTNSIKCIGCSKIVNIFTSLFKKYFIAT